VLAAPEPAPSALPEPTQTARALLVLVGGAFTTLIALAGVYACNQQGTNIMGWYADYVIPAGAFLVGIVASSGFGVASWMTGHKISGRLLLVVCALLVGAYLLAHYVEFRLRFPAGAVGEDGSSVGFFQYFDYMTRSFYWKASHSHEKDGSALGGWGYALRALELVGFVGGGVLVPARLRSHPYCAACQRYKRNKLVAVIPAGAKLKKVPKQERAAHAKEQLEAGMAALARIIGASTVSVHALDEALRKEGPLETKRSAMRLPNRIVVHLTHCPTCSDGAIKAELLSGQGQHIKRTALTVAPVSKLIAADLVRSRA